MESLPLIDAPIAVTVYQYDNASDPGRPLHGSCWAQLWAADTGRVLYAGIRGATEWHGTFQEITFNMAWLSFRFNSILLYRWGYGWWGVDNAGRQIQLTQLMRLQYDYANEVWVPANDGTM